MPGPRLSLLPLLIAGVLSTGCDPCRSVDRRFEAAAGPSGPELQDGLQAVFSVSLGALGHRILVGAEGDPRRRTRVQHRRPLPGGSELGLTARVTGVHLEGEGASVRLIAAASLLRRDEDGEESSGPGTFSVPLRLSSHLESNAGPRTGRVEVRAEQAGEVEVTGWPEASAEASELMTGAGASLLRSLYAGQPLLVLRAPGGRVSPREATLEVEGEHLEIRLSGPVAGVPLSGLDRLPSLGAGAALTVSPSAIAAATGVGASPISESELRRVLLTSIEPAGKGLLLSGVSRSIGTCAWTELRVPVRTARQAGGPGFKADGEVEVTRSGGDAIPDPRAKEAHAAAAELMRIVERRTRWAIEDSSGVAARVGIGARSQEGLTWELAWPGGPGTISAPKNSPTGSPLPGAKPALRRGSPGAD